ncbi:enoyl-CoA hydratase [Mycolicibacterium fortuitum]|uniref:Enoyl-CoA hydratase n=1 Tax=Mycolicibacterium fortuitum TaxID=1766 RepID=A0ABD6QC91_MYCFO|nr:enoyl-CoA hydratase [Mycolicibacterium fortuitum]
MTDSGPVAYRIADGAAWITLADADTGNAMSAATVAGLLESVRRATADNAKVIVLAAQGRMYSVGGDVRGFAGAPDLGRYVDDNAEAFHRVISELHAADAIVVAVVQGVAAGAGFGLAAAADIVIAAESAKFTLGYTKLGFSFDGGASLLVHTVGLHTMLRLALLNDLVTAAEAHALGLVARVVPDAELHSAAADLVGKLAAGARRAQSAVKHLLRGVANPAPVAALRAETLAIRHTAGSDDGRRGIAAFTAKEKPVFGE